MKLRERGLKSTVIAFIATAAAFCALDFAWLSIMAPGFYQNQIGPLLLATPSLPPAVVFYVLYVIGLMVFCVIPATHAISWAKSACLGALFGLCAYATYDLSNLATLEGWTLPLTLVDMAWGSLASAIASTCGYQAYVWTSRRTL